MKSRTTSKTAPPYTRSPNRPGQASPIHEHVAHPSAGSSRPGKRILLVHSTPWEPRGSYVLPTSAELQRFGEADADIVLYGHTHRQVVRRIGRVLVVNPGSAGEGRDPRNGGQLSCAVLDTVTEEVVVRDYPAPPVRPPRGPSAGSGLI